MSRGEPCRSPPSPGTAGAVGPVSRRVQLWSERRWSRLRRGLQGWAPFTAPPKMRGEGAGRGEVAGWPQSPGACGDGEDGRMPGCVLASGWWGGGLGPATAPCCGARGDTRGLGGSRGVRFPLHTRTRVPRPGLPDRRLAELRVGVRQSAAVAAIAGHGEGRAGSPAEDLPRNGVQRAGHPRLGAGGVGVRDHIRVPLVF